MINFYLSMLNTEEDKSRFEELYIKYRQRMYGLAFGVLKNKADAEDAVHQSFVIIANHFEKIKTFSCHETESYIVIITKNVSINIYKRNKKNAERFTEFDDEQLSVDVNFFEKFDYDKLVEIISDLPQIYKEILLLHYVEDFSFKEISKMLDVSIDCVRKRLERSKKLLKKELERGE